MNYSLVCFDMDGTLIYGTTANLHFARMLGVGEQVVDLEQRFRRGQIESDQFMVDVSLLMSGLTTDFVTSNFFSIPMVQGIAETLRSLSTAGAVTVIATTSNILFAECFKVHFGFDHAF